jgi:hypothetical protein
MCSCCMSPGCLTNKTARGIVYRRLLQLKASQAGQVACKGKPSISLRKKISELEYVIKLFNENDKRIQGDQPARQRVAIPIHEPRSCDGKEESTS